MISLKEVILLLEEEDYQSICKNLLDNKAEKYCKLVKLYRANDLSDEEICRELKVKANALYQLKARVLERVQEYLVENVSGPKLEILKRIVAIPSLLFNTRPDMAITILTKLRKDLTTYDMPYELAVVFRALKKLYLHHDKYYEYTQLYNQHVSYMLAYDKAEDLVSDFVKLLGDYHTSRSRETLEKIPLIKKEISNLADLYESHHIEVYKNIVNISIDLFLPLNDLVEEDDAVEDMLHQTKKIIGKYKKDTIYKYLNEVLTFLTFEYYHKYRIVKKEAQYFKELNNNLPHLLYFGHTAFVSKFLLSKVEFYVSRGKTQALYNESKAFAKEYQPDKDNVPAYINVGIFHSASAFYAQKYPEAIKTLTTLNNEISLKGHEHAEIQIKLFMLVLYKLQGRNDLTNNMARSITRKVKESAMADEYENVSIFLKAIRLMIGAETKTRPSKVKGLMNQFSITNTGRTMVLEFILYNGSLFEKIISDMTLGITKQQKDE